MKKYLIAFALLFLCSTAFSAVRPELYIGLSPGNLPTQRVEPGDQNVEILKLWMTASDHRADGVVLKKLRFLHQGSDRDQFVRYELLQGNKSLGKMSLTDSDVMQFSNLSVPLVDGKTIELRVLADISVGVFSGEHQFSIPNPEFLEMQEDDFRDDVTWIRGQFPIVANKVLTGNHIESPKSDCNLREEPVCAEDGKTYYNLCIPFQKGVKVVHEGACQHWSFKKEVLCLEVYEPICGTDGKTYSSLCHLEKKDNVFRRHDGECFPEKVPRVANFAQAVQLFDIKQTEIGALRPRVSDKGHARLEELSFVLHQYNFKPTPRRNLTVYIENFLEFTQTLSDRVRLEQEIELLNAVVIEARTDSAREKFRVGEIPFLDVDEEAWFIGPVRFLRDIGIISGYTDSNGNQTGLFGPGDPVTKAEITNMLFQIADAPFDPALTAQNPYAKNHWARNEIAVAEALKLSMWKDLPNPDKKASRAEVLRAIFEIFDVTVPTGPTRSSFIDVDYHDPDLHVIQHAKQLGIISGYGDGTFRPDDIILRAEAAKMMQKVFGFLEE
jgi:hypothetical protein